MSNDERSSVAGTSRASALPRHVYVHVPFCARRCSYCDFSIAVRRVVPVEEYLRALRRELALRYPEPSGWVIDTLYFGGGTPSRLGGTGVAQAVEAVLDGASLSPGAEVTIEANPEDVTRDAVIAWRRAGVNRLSIGSQSFDDEALAWMHRTHDASAIARAVEIARGEGIDDLSLDLIFALPTGLHRAWRRDVERALALEPTHLSLYGLTIERHTPLGRWAEAGEISESPEETYEAEFLHAHDALSAAGFEHYEVSNFARPGRRAAHNSAYWRGVPYAGLGPSAHAFDGAVRRWNVSPYVEWRERLERGEDPLGDRETLDEGNRVAETVYLGLRTIDGLALLPGEREFVAPWLDAGWGRIEDGDRLVLTPLGWLRLDPLAAALTHRRSR